MSENKEHKTTLLKLIQDAVQQDQALRDKYKIGDKFKFIRDRLQSLLFNVEESLKDIESMASSLEKKLADDEVFVYVYLFNAQGIVLQTWQKMLHPSVFYEYSVNRPIYNDKSLVEAFIRAKKNKLQSGYLTIAVKKTDILPHPEAVAGVASSSLIKVREGALKSEKLFSFTYNNQNYMVGPTGEIKKNNEVE